MKKQKSYVIVLVYKFLEKSNYWAGFDWETTTYTKTVKLSKNKTLEDAVDDFKSEIYKMHPSYSFVSKRCVKI